MQGRDIKYWIDLVYRRRLAVLEVAGAVFAIVLIGTIFWPPVYESTAEILVQDNRAQLLVSPDLLGDSAQRPTVVANPVTQQDLNSESRLLTSVYLVRQAVDDLPLPHRYLGPVGAFVDGAEELLSLPAQGYRALHDAPAVTRRDRWALATASSNRS